MNFTSVSTIHPHLLVSYHHGVTLSFSPSEKQTERNSAVPHLFTLTLLVLLLNIFYISVQTGQ